MRAYICDVCLKHEESQTGGNDLQPPGWYTITNYVAPPYNRHVCGAPCLVAFGQRLQVAYEPEEVARG